MARDRLLRRIVRERFIVTLKSGETFDGLLDEVDDRTVTFVAAGQLDPRSGRAAIDGRLYLPRDGIAYMQRPEQP